MTNPQLKSVWLCPPLAFARFGRGDIPLENYRWVKNDYQARGTGETVIEPALTLVVNPAGDLSSYVPQKITFRDQGHWRPVCPFFEVHAEWSNGESGPLTMAHLKRLGISLADVHWTIHASNRKAYHYTLDEADLVEASLELGGKDHSRHALLAQSPRGAKHPLLPEGAHLSLGEVQVVRPNHSFPELRLRITPPGGHIYAPSDTASKDLSALLGSNEGKAEFLAQIRPILNPKAAWAKWKPNGDDGRTQPGGLYAQDPEGNSLGFLDDMNDGRICFSMDAGGERWTAYARYTCCPPDFQPDRRPFVSIADGLKDLTEREEASDPGFISGSNWGETEEEIADLMQRVRETMEASNLDHQNLRSRLANANQAYPFPPQAPRPGHPLPLTERGRANHARFLAYEVFKERLAKDPSLFEGKVRDPTAPIAPYDSKMPALMRGSDGNPMTLTQRQHSLMERWLESVRGSADSESGEDR